MKTANLTLATAVATARRLRPVLLPNRPVGIPTHYILNYRVRYGLLHCLLSKPKEPDYGWYRRLEYRNKYNKYA